MEESHRQDESRAPEGCDPDDYDVVEELSKLWSSSDREITRFSYGFCVPAGGDDATDENLSDDSIGRTGRVSFLRIDSFHPPTVPPTIGKLSSLKQLTLAASNIETLPGEVGNLVDLADLNLAGCTSLRSLPEELSNCSSSLERINLPDSNLLEELPASIGKLKKLRVLSMDISSLKKLPTSFQGLGKLTDLILSASTPRSSYIRSFAKSMIAAMPSGLESLAISISLLVLLPEEFLKNCKVKTLRLEWDINDDTCQTVKEAAMKKFGALETVDCLWIEAPKRNEGGALLEENPPMPGASLTIPCELISALPNLKDFLIEGRNGYSFQLDLRKILKACEKLEELHVKSCHIVDDPTASTEIERKEHHFYPRLRILGLESTIGLCNPSSRDQTGHLLSTLHFPNLGILKICRDKAMDGNALELICHNLLQRCPRLVALDFRECNIANTSHKAICSLPPKLREFNLTGNPLLSESSWKPNDDLWQLVRKCPQLGFVGVPGREGDSDRTDDDDASKLQTSFGLHLALNRARSKVLLNQRVPLSTWSLVLQTAYHAFHDDDDEVDVYQNTPWDGVPCDPDAIFHLLRDRGVADIFPAPRRQ